jgi:hypothetical protein
LYKSEIIPFKGTGNRQQRTVSRKGGGLYLPQTSFPLKRGGFKPSIKGTEKRAVACSPRSLRGNSPGERNQEIIAEIKLNLTMILNPV